MDLNNKYNKQKKVEYILPEAEKSNDNVQDLVQYEAKGTAWSLIGIPAGVSYKLAKFNITPKELQSLLKDYSIKGIGFKVSLIIEKLNETDFNNFNIYYEELQSKESWVWKLAEWYNTLSDGCTNGNYLNKKSYFKKDMSIDSDEKKDMNIVFPEVKKSDDKIQNLAYYEARGTSWSSIGIPGNISYKLATREVTPKELKMIVEKHTIKGIGAKTESLIKQFNEADFEKFNNCYEQLKKKCSWTWKLAKWRIDLPDGCTNGEYIDKKAFFKNKELQKLKSDISMNKEVKLVKIAIQHLLSSDSSFYDDCLSKKDIDILNNLLENDFDII